MQFQVPQFIEVEDKIFGPLTFKQFVYLAGGAGVAYLIWRSLPLYAAAPLALALAGLGVALAFFQYNGQPFILALEHGFFYIIRSKLYLWNNEVALASKKKSAISEKSMAPTTPFMPHLSESKLHELSWSLDIQERISNTEQPEEPKAKNPMDLVAPIRTARDALVR